ncbi:AAA family ATPase [Pedobacter sp. SYSU D00535]|uniref:GumC family protein n=1 Tax=Pedobacter sp. SYSU D00535 TaxID=2810308 RepID=UPI001A974159|nr:AAA family ATPase [Pedobacter sp. SYSU D00535]
MEIQKFINLLLRHKLTLIILPAVAVIITYYIVTHLPDSYQSQAQISTGIVDETQKSSVDSDNQNRQEAQVQQEFSNLIEMMKMKKIIDQVSYKLIMHDLTSKEPFRKHSSLLTELDPAAKKHAYQVYKKKYQNREGLNLWNADQNGLHRLLRSMRYEEEAIKQKLLVYRAGNSDFIYVEFSSENPELSAFVANAICEEFIKYYTVLVKENKNKAKDFWAKLLQEKYQAMNEKILGLKNYKIQNRVLNLYEQSRILYGQIIEFEAKKVLAEKDVIAAKGALKNIDGKFSPQDRRYIEATQTRINQDILDSKRKLMQLSDQYIQSGYDPRYKTSIDSMKRILTLEINNLSDKYITNPLNAKQDLVSRKIMLEIQHDLDQYSLQRYEEELEELNNRFDQLVPNEAVVQTFERDIDITSREYLEILNKYNLTSMESGYSIKLKQVQMAMPGLAQPSKKMLLVILSGMISFVFCFVIIFLLFFLDNSITTPKELAQRTKSSVLGYLNALPGNLLDINNIWKGQNQDKEIVLLKEQLRSIRFELEKEFSGKERILGITSLRGNEGKTFVTLNLAYAFAMIGKKVLLIDGNFISPSISKTVNSNLFLEDILKEKNQDSFLSVKEAPIVVLSNRGGDNSLLELSSEQNIKNKLKELQDLFDIIIIETSPLDSLSKAKEWFVFTNKVLGVFEAGQSINEYKRQNINYLKALSDQFAGWVLNKTKNEKEAKKKKSKTWFFTRKKQTIDLPEKELANV